MTRASKSHMQRRARPTLAEAASRSELRLDLGCGQHPKEGFEGVDLYSKEAKHKVNLFTFPWPWADNSVDEIHASHFLEHVPAREVEDRDLNCRYGHEDSDRVHHGNRFLGQDMLFAFMDECYRILKVDGWMHIIVPSARSNRAFQDPTHRRFFVQETFFYFNHDWRKANGLEHYRAKSHFGFDVGHSVPQQESLRSEAAQAERFMHYWNVTFDWIAKLKKLPPPVLT